MGKTAEILKLRPETVVIDRFGGGEMTVAELTMLVGSMLRTDTPEDIDSFCERFDIKPNMLLDTPRPGAYPKGSNSGYTTQF